MSIQAHLTELERRHADMERAIQSALNSPSSDPLHINELKRKKLQLKDEITKYKDSRLDS
ncbi:YdcH family protein [Polycladidibacter stylochi]|uniref:YdcH family protein n=1 Tax=Polycladidibacter stylochi TaxID=1807766 RepID=UPI00082E456A|nr:DUF465 domain-containing protein [Pseudovibrio stylochi]